MRKFFVQPGLGFMSRISSTVVHTQTECYSKKNPYMKIMVLQLTLLITVYENGMIQIHSLPEEHPLMIKCIACFCALIF